MKNLRGLLFLLLLPFLGIGQIRQASTNSKAVFALQGKKSRPRVNVGENETASEKSTKGHFSIYTARGRSFFPKTEAELNEPTLIKSAPVALVKTTHGIDNELEIVALEIQKIQAEITKSTEKMARIESLVSEIDNLSNNRLKGLKNKALRESQDARVWSIADSLLTKDDGQIPKMLIASLDNYLSSYRARKDKKLTVPQREIKNVVTCYSAQIKIDPGGRLKGDWWKAKPYSKIIFNPEPELGIRISFRKERNGMPGVFPLKTLRNSKVSSGCFFRNVQHPWFSEITGNMEIGDSEDTDGYRNNIRHRGIDIAFDLFNMAPDIQAFRSGYVVYSSYNASWNEQEKMNIGYGNVIVIEHGRDSEGRPLLTLYAHLSKMKVEAGDWINIGEVIGKGGRSGTKRSHLHFEILYGDMSLDAETFFNLRESSDDRFRYYHSGKGLYEMPEEDYYIYPQGICTNERKSRDWTFTVAPVSACKIDTSIESPDDIILKQRFVDEGVLNSQ
ncbi:MAG: hypothetical protein ACI88L_000360 [Candidatus Paceibacteria bacterium]|jgi:hypothetical protein